MKFAGAGYADEPETNWLVPTRRVFPLSPAIHARNTVKDMIDGTDASPLRLRYYVNHYKNSDCAHCNGNAANSIWYMELTRDDDRAPTDYVLKNCQPNGYSIYPSICQQYQAVAGCPPLSTTIHASIAVGMLALLDPNPCDVENGRLPTNYHLSVFDGLKWTDLKSGRFTPEPATSASGAADWPGLTWRSGHPSSS